MRTSTQDDEDHDQAKNKQHKKPACGSSGDGAGGGSRGGGGPAEDALHDGDSEVTRRVVVATVYGPINDLICSNYEIP